MTLSSVPQDLVVINAYLYNLKKFTKIFKKILAFFRNGMYNNPCCDMIAMKREVATHCGRFSVERMSS